MTTSDSTTEALPEKPKSKWLKRLGWGFGGLLFVCILGLVGLRMVYSDAYFKTGIEEALQKELNRKVEVESLSIAILSGQVDLNGLVVHNADSTFEGNNLLTVKHVAIKVALWPIVTSSGKTIDALTIDIQKPEVFIERRETKHGSETNIDDLIEKYTSGPKGVWPKRTGLEALDATIQLHEGAIFLKDKQKGKGDSELSGIELEVALPSLGAALKAQLTFAIKTPGMTDKGVADIQLEGIALDEGGVIDPEKLKDLSVKGDLNEVDIAHLGRYFDWQWPLLKGKYEGTLGRPLTGSILVAARTIAAVKVDMKLETDGLVAIWESAERVADGIPATLNISVECGWKNGVFQEGPSHANLSLAGTKTALKEASSNGIQFSVSRKPATSGGEESGFAVKGSLKELLNTDVGTVLGLNGLLDAGIDGRIDLVQLSSGAYKLAVKMKLELVDGFGKTHSTDLTLAGLVRANPEGYPSSAELDIAAKSYFVTLDPQGPLKVSSLDNWEKLTVDAGFTYALHGKRLRMALAPILKVLDLDRPWIDRLDGTLKIAGADGQVAVKMDGVLVQEPVAGKTYPDLALKLEGNVDGKAWKAGGGKRYLNLDLDVKAPSDDSIAMKIHGVAKRTKADPDENISFGRVLADLKEASVVAQFTPDAVIRFQALGLIPNEPLFVGDVQVKAGLDADAKFLEVTQCRFMGEAVRASLIAKKVDLTRLGGLNARSSWADKIKALPEAAFSLSVTAPVFSRLKQLKLIPDAALFSGEAALNAYYSPGTESLTLSSATYAGPAGTLALKGAKIDLNDAVALLKPQFTFADVFKALGDFSMTAHVQPPLFTWLRTEKLLPAEPVLSGELKWSSRYVSTGRQIHVEQFDYTRAKGNRSPLTKLSMKGVISDVEGLLKKQAQLAEHPAQLLTHLDQGFQLTSLKFSSKDLAAFLRRGKPGPSSLWLQQPPLDGEVEVQARYEPKDQRLILSSLTYERRQGSTVPLVNLVAGVEVARLGTLLKNVPTTPLAVMDFLDKGIQIRSLTLSPLEGPAYLKAMGINDPMLAQIGPQGTIQPSGYVQLKDVLLLPPDEDTMSGFRLSFMARTPGTYRFPPEAGKPPVQAVLSGWYGFSPQQPLTFLPGLGVMVFDGRLNLDQAGLYCGLLKKPFNIKPPKMASSLRIKGRYGTDGSIEFGRLTLKGGPIELDLKKFFLNAAPQLKARLASLDITKGPFLINLSNVDLDEAKDRLQVSGSAPKLQLDQLNGFNVFPDIVFGGRFDNAKFSYNGRYGALARGEVDKLTAVDQYAIQATARDVQVNVKNASRKKSYTWRVDGGLISNPSRLSSGGSPVRITLDAQMPRTGRKRKIYFDNLGAIDVSANKPGGVLLNALSASGMPITVNAPIAMDSELNVDVILDGLTALGEGFVGEAGSTKTVTAPVRPKTGNGAKGGLTGFEDYRFLRVESSLRVPKLLSSGYVLDDVQIPSFSLNQLKVNLPRFQCGLYRGTFALSKAFYDLSIPGIKHQQEFAISNVRLGMLPKGVEQQKGAFAWVGKLFKALLMGSKDSSMRGQLTASGSLAGTGFEGPKMKTWNGKLDLGIVDLTLITGKGRAPDKLFKGVLKGLGDKYGGKLDGVLGKRYGRKVKRASQAYTNDFGLVLDKMEFKPLKLNATIKAGQLVVAPSSLFGKNKSEGLQLDFEGAVDLPGNRFAPAFTVWLVKVPPQMQETLLLHELDEKDRNEILGRFERKEFQSIVVQGSLDKPVSNTRKFVMAISALEDEIFLKLEEKAAREKAEREAKAQAELEAGTNTEGDGANKPATETDGTVEKKTEPPAEDPNQPEPEPEVKKEKSKKFNPFDLLKDVLKGADE